MNFNDIVKKETTYSFKEGAFSFDKAYRVKYKGETHICLLEAYSNDYVKFSYGPYDGITTIRITPEELIKSNAGKIEIIEAVFKVDVPEVKIVSEWKTVKEAFATPGYFNNGDCYEIRFESEIGLFQKTVKGFLSEYYPTSEKLRFVVHACSSNVAAVKQHYWYNYITMKPEGIDTYDIIEESITNGAVVDIDVKDATDNVKIRRLR